MDNFVGITEELRFEIPEFTQLWLGRYEHSTQYLARVAVLRALEVHAPVFVSELRDIQEKHGAEKPESLDWLHDGSSRDRLAVLDHFPHTKEALVSLLNKMNLLYTMDDWFLRVCIDYLDEPVTAEMAHTANPSAVTPGALKDLYSEEGFSFSVEPWIPTKETRKTYEGRIRTWFDVLFFNYLKKAELKAMQHGKKIAHQPGGLLKGVVPKDAIRLIYYQVLGRSPNQIAEMVSMEVGGEGISYQAVTEGITRFAALVGIDLRPNNSGVKVT